MVVTFSQVEGPYIPVNHPDGVQQFRSHLFDWSENNLREFPWRDPDATTYEVLVAEILLQRTPAERVEPIYDEVVGTYPSLADLADADPDDVATILTPLGLQNKRGKALVKIGTQLAERGIPTAKAELMELPYVNLYVANATLCFGFGERRPIVDANVVRVYERAFGVDLDERARDDETWAFAEQMLPDGDVRWYNLALLDFSAAICAPRTPDCQACFFTDHCHYYANNR